jgi:chromosome segregation ATPase
MVFLLLALVALVFSLLGFLVHAFYFSKGDLAGSLQEEAQSLKRILAFREKESQEAREESTKFIIQAQLLERQVEQQAEQINALQVKLQEQENEIRQLQRAEPDIPVPADAMENPVPVAAQESRVQKTPLWKDNLNNILGVLDKIEKETEK